MKVLVTGGTGLLGSRIRKKSSHWFYPDRKQLNITNEKQIEDFLRDNKFTEHDVILHCAALTGIKQCEDMKHKARLTNVTGTENIVRSAYRRNCSIIYISTDYVFLGKKGNYKEGDRPDPTTYYGRTKWEAEKYVLGFGNSTVVRTSFCKDDEWAHPAAFDDKFSSFVKLSKLVPVLIRLVEDEYRPLGLLHVAGKRKSFYEMAKSINPDVGRISLKDMDLEIPVDTSLDVTRFNKIYGGILE